MRLVIALLLLLVAIIGAMFVAINQPAKGDDVRRSSYQTTTDTDAITLPPTNADWDYQLGGVKPPAADVGIVSRDRTAKPSPNRYNICYVNAFQTQDSEQHYWRDNPDHWRLVLKKDGKPVVDSGWGEWLLDTRTAAKREALARILGRWIAGCDDSGYDAVEFDNLDSFLRSKGLITRAQNKAFASLLIERAHRHLLAAAQKNWVELGAAGPALGFDFAVAEQCGEYRECGGYAAAYGDRVLVVEYTKASYTWTCAHFGDQLSVVRRDLDLTPGGVRAYC